VVRVQPDAVGSDDDEFIVRAIGQRRWGGAVGPQERAVRGSGDRRLLACRETIVPGRCVRIASGDGAVGAAGGVARASRDGAVNAAGIVGKPPATTEWKVALFPSPPPTVPKSAVTWFGNGGGPPSTWFPPPAMVAPTTEPLTELTKDPPMMFGDSFDPSDA